MRVRPVHLLCVFAGAAMCAGTLHAQQSAPAAPPRETAARSSPAPTKPPEPSPTAEAPGPEAFSGIWDYNAEESVNALTGRQEQAPRSATARRPGAAGRTGGTGSTSSGTSTSGRGGGSGGGGTGGGGPVGGGTGGPTGTGGGFPGGGVGPGGFGGGGGFGRTMFDNRDLVRDLVEVPESLLIAVSSDTVKFVDDLERDQTYMTDGKKQKFILGAAQYTAKTSWQGKQFRKEIEGPYGFKMTETFFLSTDGRRMFVILRIPDPNKKDMMTIAINRVYDRIDR
jgi:hypothetical protein